MDKSPAYLSECVKLCSKHFEPGQYAEGSSKRLRKNAEPTVFDFRRPPKPHVVKRRRLGRLQKAGEKRASAEQGESAACRGGVVTVGRTLCAA